MHVFSCSCVFLCATVCIDGAEVPECFHVSVLYCIACINPEIRTTAHTQSANPCANLNHFLLFNKLSPWWTSIPPYSPLQYRNPTNTTCTIKCPNHFITTRNRFLAVAVLRQTFNKMPRTVAGPNYKTKQEKMPLFNADPHQILGNTAQLHQSEESIYFLLPLIQSPKFTKTHIIISSQTLAEYSVVYISTVLFHHGMEWK